MAAKSPALIFSEEKQLFLHENMVNFVNQYNQPIIEVSLVVSKYIRIILEKLQETASLSDETLPIEIFSLANYI